MANKNINYMIQSGIKIVSVEQILKMLSLGLLLFILANFTQNNVQEDKWNNLKRGNLKEHFFTCNALGMIGSTFKIIS